ncbi:hypothetical protein MB901379_03500 [Mycobacterium basiliense]|uniref:Thioesterase domain-containing protein n=1 Tax=Mycobacterium basiliense TaxID=2094119 RepID=A0A3S4BY18_9MYCO|nr:hypothetical protein [Mycobacterium basiliense]VDM89914.1 hypothetical protein MB901379_03500 [Mycobacterium basiliense]
MAEGAPRGDAGVAGFGEAPLAQTVAAAGAIRRLSSLLLALEHPHPTVDVMVTRFAEWEEDLAATARPDSVPRMGGSGDATRRIYLDHATDIGAYNPCFPEYRFDQLDIEKACGRVTFPLVYEGPPGLVHGGFLGVFFDCVVQHHSCVSALSGKTRSLAVTFRRPTPVLTELRFEIVRSQTQRGVNATARLLHDDEVLCIGEVDTVVSQPEGLAPSQFARRRKEPDS